MVEMCKYEAKILFFTDSEMNEVLQVCNSKHSYSEFSFGLIHHESEYTQELKEVMDYFWADGKYGSVKKAYPLVGYYGFGVLCIATEDEDYGFDTQGDCQQINELLYSAIVVPGSFIASATAVRLASLVVVTHFVNSLADDYDVIGALSCVQEKVGGELKISCAEDAYMTLRNVYTIAVEKCIARPAIYKDKLMHRIVDEVLVGITDSEVTEYVYSCTSSNLLSLLDAGVQRYASVELFSGTRYLVVAFKDEERALALFSEFCVRKEKCSAEYVREHYTSCIVYE